MAPPDDANTSATTSSATEMYKHHLEPPGKFSFSPTEWPKWKRRFERFRVASGLNKSAESIQVNTLLYVMGDDAEDIYASFSWTRQTDAEKYDAVIAKFESHFIPRRNVIHERYMFNRRHQLLGESSDSFITALYTLSEHCEYGQMRDDLIRDHIVLGIRDGDLSKKMQMVADLTLAKAIQMVRTHESVEREGQLQRGDANSPSVDRVNRKPQRTFHQSNSFEQSCSRCGNEPHSRKQCPASTAKCLNCGLVGHFAKLCRSKSSKSSSSTAHQKRSSPKQRRRVKAVDADFEGESSDDNSFYIGQIRKSIRHVESEWIFTAKIGENIRKFEIDSGADETVAPPSYYNEQFELSKPEIRLDGPDGHPLHIIGMQKLPITYRDTTSIQNVYLIRNQKTALLGKPAIKAFNLIRRTNRIEKSNSNRPEKRYSDRFKGLGELPDDYKIVLKDDAKPFAITVPRKVPLPLLDSTESTLKKMVETNVISPIIEPTDWVAPLVVVPKRNSTVRICVDFSRLNNSVKREYFPIPPVEDTLAKLKGGKVFSKLDANSGFYQIRLAEESKKLTTFLTPFGRYYFNRLPMGITSAPEHFQSQMQKVLSGCKNVVCHMDDVLVWGATEAEHDENLVAVFEKLRAANVTLNEEKSLFRKTSLKFLGHIISNGQVAVDPEKVKAIAEMTPPKDKKELQSLLGTLNFLARHIPNRSENLEPLYALLRKNVPFHWDQAQDEAFQYLKRLLSAAPVLTIYDKTKPLIVSCDASSYGIGAVLLQQDENKTLHPVSYISRTLSKAEQRYAQIEKELLAIAWACERFDRYLVGLQFRIETDHKPLVPILTTKFLDDLSPRLQRLRMKLMRFYFDVSHTPGKDLVTADLLSRKPVGSPQPSDEALQKELQSATIGSIKLVPASSKMLGRIRDAQRASSIGQQLLSFIREGWPKTVPDELVEYSKYQASLNVYKGLILYCQRIWIPHSMRDEILKRLHSSHMGQTKMYSLAQTSIWWPKLRDSITKISDSCMHCAQHRPNKSEPLITTPLPSDPWRKVGVDLLKKDSKWYIVVIDYYSKYIELSHLPRLDTRNVIQRLEVIFARHGIPEIVFTDNGTQLTSDEMQRFAEEWDFKIVTRSPSYPQANGLAEAAVKIAKRVLDTTSPNQALMLYRATPNSLGYSPAQLLMNRQIRTIVPAVDIGNRIPKKNVLRRNHEKRRQQMEYQFNRAHGATPLSELSPGTKVYVEDIGQYGVIVRKRSEPRSYDVRVDNGAILRRNRKTLRCPKNSSSFDPDLFNTTSTSAPQQSTSESATPSKIPKPVSTKMSGEYKTRFGRTVTEPDRFQAVGPIRDRSKSDS